MDQKITPSENITQFLTSMGYIADSFRQNVAGQILIDAKLNGVAGIYILDTGASQTVVDTKQVAALRLELNYDEAVSTGGGVGAHGIENIPSYNNTIEIEGFKMDDLVVAVMSLETAWESLAQVGAHEELSGIIGVDILKRGNAIIDLSAMRVFLMQPLV